MTTTILVLSGGGPAPTTALPHADVVIAADSGFELADELDVEPDLVIGDLDSIGAAQLADVEARSIPIQDHPEDKDATDLELSLLEAIDRGATRIVVAGGGAGRLDHLLGLALLLCDDRWSDVEIEWHAGESIARVVRGECEIAAAPGDLVSVLPVTDAVASISGTRWPLVQEPLRRGTTRGVSNEATHETVIVTAHRGVVLAITTEGEHP